MRNVERDSINPSSGVQFSLRQLLFMLGMSGIGTGVGAVVFSESVARVVAFGAVTFVIALSGTLIFSKSSGPLHYAGAVAVISAAAWFVLLVTMANF